MRKKILDQSNHPSTSKTYKIPEDIYSIIAKAIGSCPGQLIVMYALIGSNQGKAIDYEEMMNKFDLSRASFYRAIKGLKDIGFIDITKDSIKINYDKIQEAA